MGFVLRDLLLQTGERTDIAVAGGRIVRMGPALAPSAATDLQLDGCSAFPGLINSHDHLDFNLFPRLGHATYRNYLEWGRDIHERDKELIASVLRIPKALRARWGLYKNLLAGVTTVVHHGAPVPLPEDLIHVFTACHSLHSVRLEKRWRWKLNRPFANDQAFVLHVGEGTDGAAHAEINRLLRWNLRRRRLIGVHGVAMDAAQAARFEALVWCPDSNFFLLGATAAVDVLKTSTKILLGTDSTVSADWNFWNHLRLARSTGLLDDDALLRAVTTTAAAVWRLPGKGVLREGADADLIVAKSGAAPNGTARFFALNPQDLLLVLSRGQIVLFDATLRQQVGRFAGADYSRIRMAGTDKFVKGDLPGLMRQIKQFYPGAEFPVTAA